MNFLAHIYLSGFDDELTVGNFIGDFVKGAQYTQYPERVQTGILLHRSIDEFTDTHAIVLKSKERLRPEFSHYSPVIVDVFYDHFLARDWEQFSKNDLLASTQSFYQMIGSFKSILPDAVKHMILYMKRDNWLYNYRLLEGMERALSGMARRTKFNSKMEHAARALKENYEEFGDEFHAFFPELQDHCRKFIAEHK